MNTTVTGTNCAISFNSAAAKNGKTRRAYCLIFIVSLLGNSFVGIIVGKTQAFRKPINFFIVSIAISDLLYPIFFFPPEVVYLYSANSWLISGALGQALCRLVPFLVNVCSYVSIQSLVLIAVVDLERRYFHFVVHSSVQSCAPSSFSPRGSSLWLPFLQISSLTNLLQMKDSYFVKIVGVKCSECLSLITITS